MKIVIIFLLALQTVNSFSFPSATLFPIPESTTESTTESEASPKRVSQEALYSALSQIRLTLLKNLQVIGKIPIHSSFKTYYILVFQVTSKAKLRPGKKMPKLNDRILMLFSKEFNEYHILMCHSL